MESHAEFLRRVTIDEEMVEALRHDYENAPISAADRAMCDFSIQLTKNPVKLGPGDLDNLREHGFDDQGILQITLIASWFNYVNRVADALGVGRGQDQGETN